MPKQKIKAVDQDTIAAIATATGQGGIGIVRLSGPLAYRIGTAITGAELTPRYAKYTAFIATDKSKIDEGIALYFPGPDSFTGEDIIELQGHGGSVVLDLILNQAINHGARLARPGEFSERAFLNDKIDLIQAEAIADIIESTTAAAAKSAVRSLSGEFSNKINQLTNDITRLRVYVEAAIDFPDEEVDFISDQHIIQSLDNLLTSVEKIIKQARQGSLLRDGLSVVIIGKPNAGKSSLLNLLAGDDLAIVNKQAGTTRDSLREDINIDGLPLRIIDTAGLRKSNDEIEQEGIRRAKKAIEQADIILFMRDASELVGKNSLDAKAIIEAIHQELISFDISPPDNTALIVVNNKIDLNDQSASVTENQYFTEIAMSAKTGEGIELFSNTLKTICGYNNNNENNFVARTRHIDALNNAYNNILNGKIQLIEHLAGELLAEDLRQAQNNLGTITGTFTSDDLLGEIFSSFCIGK